MLYLVSRSRLVLTDSGGLQEEAPALRVPVLVMRDVTERPEGVVAGVAKLVGTGEDAIISAVRDILLDGDAYDKMQGAKNPYGDGKAAERIVSLLLERV
jgi:UDP-N-acetylglucosamine 2-epimerase